MLSQQQPNRWSCLPTSLAMCLGIPVQEIFDLLGHDGSEIFWPGLPEPERRRSFSYHEMIYVAKQHGTALIICEKKWYLAPNDNIIRHFDPPKGYWEKCLRDNWGVLCGKTPQGRRHAVAWDTENVYDPNGTIYNVFDAELFLACCRLPK